MKKIIGMAAASAFAIAAISAPVAAKPPVDAANGYVDGASCLVAGVSFLKENDLVSTVAREGLEYPAGSGDVYRLPKVLELHRTNPELFPWCAVD